MLFVIVGTMIVGGIIGAVIGWKVTEGLRTKDRLLATLKWGVGGAISPAMILGTPLWGE